MTYTASVYTQSEETTFTVEADSQREAFQSIREVTEARHPSFRLVRVYQTGVGPSIGRIHPTR